jgi:sugar transferase (PEP-CTERM/EpsH1 system associated)
MISHLSNAHSVTVVSLAESQQELLEGQNLKNYCSELLVELVPPAVRWSRASAALIAGRSASVSYFWSPRLSRRVRELTRRKAFDAVLVHCAFVSPYVRDVSSPIRVLDFGDLDSAKWEAYGRHRRFPLSRVYALEARRLRAFEERTARQFHHCTVSTDGELEQFRALNLPILCTVIPNGVNIAATAREPSSENGRPVIAFVGRMDYFPNIDAAVYFATDILPRIRERIPTVQLKIIGSNPTLRVRRLAHRPGVIVTGHVPDVRTHLENATVSVAPLRIARGVQNKILEAMALGIPVVASPEAAKGIQASSGVHFLEGRDPEEFAHHVCRIINDVGLRCRLVSAARRQIDRIYQWPRSMAMLDKLLDRLSHSHSAEINGAGLPSEDGTVRVASIPHTIDTNLR